MKLEKLQQLPHKWWKRNVPYEPCLEDIKIDFKPKVFYEYFDPQTKFEILTILDEVQEVNYLKPTKFDYLLAINIELYEFFEAKDVEDMHFELADVAIFCALALKNIYNSSPLELLNYKKETYQLDILPIYSTHPNVKAALFTTLIFALGSHKIKEKIEFNKRRTDHDILRY